MSNQAAIRVMEQANQITNLPPSANGSVLLYAGALAALMSLAVVGLWLIGWMCRDTWRDRYYIHPKSLLFNLRAIVGLVGLVTFMRTLPEVLYLQVYGLPGVSQAIQAKVLMTRQLANIIALPTVMFWMLLLIAIYPSLCIALKSFPANAVIVDRAAVWPRLAKPFGVFGVILISTMLFACSKAYLI